MATFDHTSFQTQVTSDERGLSTWLVWIISLSLGLMLLGLGFYQQRQEEGSIGSTIVVATQMQSHVTVMQSEANLTAFGNAGSIERLSQARTRMQSDLSLLERGGFASNNDKYPVLVNAGGLSTPLKNVSQQFGIFSAALQPMLGAYDALNSSITAESNVTQVVGQLRNLSSSMASSPRLSTGAWDNALSPVRRDLTRAELDSVQALFAPSAGGSVLAKQWSDLLANRAQEAVTLAQLGAKDTSLSDAERNLLNEFANRARLLSRYATVLYQTQDVRFQARSSLEQVAQSGQALHESTQVLVDGVKSLHRARSNWSYVFWSGLALTLLGLGGVLRSLWVMGYERWRAQQDGFKGTVLSQAIEKSTREMRRILSLETNNEKLLQPPDSPIFPLISMINQSLGQRVDAFALIEEQSRLLQKGIFDLEGTSGLMMGKTASHKNMTQEMMETSTHNSEVLALLCQALEEVISSTQRSLEGSYKGGAVSQEISWKMQSLRENTQSTAKRIKRLGEGAQTIGASSDLIKDMIRKVKVLALNLAVEAASYGEDGKTFASLARELERLAFTAQQSVQDIDNQILVIQTDAKETVSSMENGITDVVEVAKLSGETMTAFREQDRLLERLKVTQESTLSQLETTVLSVAQTANQANTISTDIDQQEEELKELKAKNDQFRAVLSSLRRWLNTMGRDI